MRSPTPSGIDASGGYRAAKHSGIRYSGRLRLGGSLLDARRSNPKRVTTAPREATAGWFANRPRSVQSGQRAPTKRATVQAQPTAGGQCAAAHRSQVETAQPVGGAVYGWMEESNKRGRQKEGGGRASRRTGVEGNLPARRARTSHQSSAFSYSRQLARDRRFEVVVKVKLQIAVPKHLLIRSQGGACRSVAIGSLFRNLEQSPSTNTVTKEDSKILVFEFYSTYQIWTRT